MSASGTSVGFVGLGHMGGNMAARFLAAGHAVYGEQRSREHAQELIEQGLQWRDTPREVAEAAGVVFTSVPDEDALEVVASGPDGILAGLGAGKTWVDVSTVSPQASREARVTRECSRRADARRAGVGKRPPGAVRDAHDHGRGRRGGLPRGGAAPPRARHAELRRRQRPGARAQARDQHQPGRADARVRRGAAPRRALGGRPAACPRDHGASPIGSPMLRARASIILDPPEEAWFDLRFMHKDIELALETARSLQIPLPTAERADLVLAEAEELGYERRDLAALFQALEQIADTPAEVDSSGPLV